METTMCMFCSPEKTVRKRQRIFSAIFVVTTTILMAKGTEAAFVSSFPPYSSPRINSGESISFASPSCCSKQYFRSTSTTTTTQLDAFFRSRRRNDNSSSEDTKQKSNKKKEKTTSESFSKSDTTTSTAADDDDDDMLHFPSHEKKKDDNHSIGKSSSKKSSKKDNEVMNHVVASTTPPPSTTTTTSEQQYYYQKGVNSNVPSTDDDNIEWHVYVDQSKPSKERGAGATLDAFIGLSPSQVQVHSAIFRSKSKGPVVRCVKRSSSSSNEDQQVESSSSQGGGSIEVSNVDSVDKVFRILTYHMNLKGYVDNTARECLKYKYKGNAHLEANEIKEALDSYAYALDTNYKPQEGIILLMRATAYLRRAYQHQQTLRDLVFQFRNTIPQLSTIQLAYEQAMKHPSIANPILNRIIDTDVHIQKEFEGTKYRHGLYQYALLHSAQDALRATQLLPDYSKSWLRAGQILNELWKLNESTQYYDKALEVDPSLDEKLKPIMEKIAKRQELLNGARQYGWTQDETIRIALDVVG